MPASPTSRSLVELRRLGYQAGVVERFNWHTNRKSDLFGILDLVAIRPGETLGVQACAGASHAARLTKVCTSPFLPDLLAAGWRVEVWSWRKGANGRWALRREALDGE